MFLTTTIRNIGKSKGAIIPAKALKEAGIKLGDEMKVEVTQTGLHFSRVNKKPTLEELLAKCNLDAPITDELSDWGMSNGNV